MKTLPGKKAPSPPLEQILRALLIKVQYIISFLLSMLIIFWISLSAVNIFHFIIAIFFVFILLHLNSDMFSSSSTKMTVYWRRLIIFTQAILFSRYFYELQLKDVLTIDADWLAFTGLNYEYSLKSYLKYSIGFITADYGSNTLTWIMYINCVQFYMQSKDFERSNLSQIVLQQVTNKLYNIVSIIYHKTFLYLIYSCIMLIVIQTSPSAINIFIFIIILIPFNKFFKVMNTDKT